MAGARSKTSKRLLKRLHARHPVRMTSACQIQRPRAAQRLQEQQVLGIVHVHMANARSAHPSFAHDQSSPHPAPVKPSACRSSSSWALFSCIFQVLAR
eukprot:scaffold111081_cov17-Tisochrysis_lutea.AAC.2